MKILPISDLHLERRSLPLPELDSDFDVLVCAGDVHEADPNKSIEALVSLSKGKPVIMVPGNHDFYSASGRSLEATENILREAATRISGELVQVLVGGQITRMKTPHSSAQPCGPTGCSPVDGRTDVLHFWTQARTGGRTNLLSSP